MKALGPATWFRYGGGAWADAYDWQTNVDTYAGAQARVQERRLHARRAVRQQCPGLRTDFPSYMAEVWPRTARKGW